MKVLWVVTFIAMSSLAFGLVVRGRRKGDGAWGTFARWALVGIPLSISLDHVASGSEHLGIGALVGILLIALGMIWTLVRSRA